MVNKKSLIFRWLVIALVFVWLQGATRSEPVEAQSFPQHPGFPRFEPRNTITFGSPSVVDINGDGHLDILVPDGNGCVWAWDRNGNVLANYPLMTGSSCQANPRINGPLAIGDIDGDGDPEIAAGTRGTGTGAGQRGRVFVWHANGTIVTGWPKEMAWNVQFGSGLPEVNTVAMGNLAGTGSLEIVAGTSNNSSNGGTPDDPTHNLYAYQANGTVLTGFPTQYRRAGIWGFVGLADTTGTGYAQIFTGRDHSFLHAYNAQGSPFEKWPAPAYVKNSQPNGLFMEFTRDSPSIGDIDNDGTYEIAIAGKVRDPNQNRAVIGSAVWVLQAKGSREAGWYNAKLGGTPVYTDFPPTQSPALADLNGDGDLEIIVGLLDGTMRAYHPDGNLMWKYDFAQGKRLFASEPVIGDVTGDGRLDVIFGTYSPDNSADSQARLIGLNASGQPLPGFPLTLNNEGGASKKGLRAAPALADMDGDCLVEIVAGSQAGVVYVWDLPAAYDPDLMPWPTARHDYQRTGFVETVDNPIIVPPSTCN
ncbi:MAG: VCBS repeat-containing protein [Chloroflexi bacterium]|nr:VCBS repeat-containing protein [Chloroflexota bacterium]